MKKSAVSGRDAIVETAISAGKFDVSADGNSCTAGGTVAFDVSLMMRNGQTKSSQVAWKIRIAAVRSAGHERGTQTLRKVVTWPAPSIRAAAMRSSGSDRKNCRIMSTASAFAATGTIIPW